MSTHACRLRALACPAALTMLLASGAVHTPTAAAAATCRGAESASGSAPRAARAAVTCQINRERRSRGLAPVTAERRLTRMAGRHARAMVRLGFFSHTAPGGRTLSDRLRAARYGGRPVVVGEALAWGQGARAAPRAIVRVWMHSPPHRAVLLGRNYRHIGIGVAPGSPYGRSLHGSATYAANFAG